MSCDRLEKMMATRYQYLQAKLTALSTTAPRLIAAGSITTGDLAAIRELCEQLIGETIEASRADDDRRAARYRSLYDSAVTTYEDLRNAMVNGPVMHPRAAEPLTVRPRYH
jgi:hypothetical protein